MSLPLNPPLADLAGDAADQLRQAFGCEPSLTAAAPGRVNLIGEHIDYCDGFVLPFAIDRYIVIAACANGTQKARIGSTGQDIVTLDLSAPQEIGDP